MVEDKVLEALRQAPLSEVGEIFRDSLTELVRDAYVRILYAEAKELCGPFYRPHSESEYKRAGTAPGYVRLSGRKMPVKRPRVAKREGGEHPLFSYSVRKNGDNIKELICNALAAGVSSNEMRRLYPDAGCVSSSSVSRTWVIKGLEMLEKLRGRELSGEKFFCLMIDGVVLSEDLTALVALGITCDGRKMMLDFEIGSSENSEVCNLLINRLLKRGFKEDKERRLLIVLDGSSALRNSVLKYFDDPVIQRCQIHKERNIRACVAKRHHTELARLFKRLRNAEGAEAAREALGDLDVFLASISAKGVESLREAGESLIAIQTLDCPSELHSTLLNTNVIENSINNIRRKTGRVKRWRSATDQAERWMGYGMQEAERGFRRIKGHKKIEKLLIVLKRPPSPTSVPFMARRSAAPSGTPFSSQMWGMGKWEENSFFSILKY